MDTQVQRNTKNAPNETDAPPSCCSLSSEVSAVVCTLAVRTDIGLYISYW